MSDILVMNSQPILWDWLFYYQQKFEHTADDWGRKKPTMKTSISWKMSQTIILMALTCLLTATQAPALAQQNQPLMFIENVGQFPVPDSGETIRFQVQADQATLSLMDEALWFTTLAQPEPAPDQSVLATSSDPLSLIPDPRQGVNLKLSFVDANPQPRLEPFNRLDTRVSFL